MDFRITAVLFLGALLGGCAGAPSWKEVRFPTPLAREDAWLLAEASVQACDFIPDARDSDPGRGEMVTLWKERLAPFGKGYRLKLHLRLLPPEEKKVKVLEFYVERQVNTSMEAPFAPKPEDWGNGGQDPGAEALFETHLATRLRRFYGNTWRNRGKSPKNHLFPGR